MRRIHPIGCTVYPLELSLTTAPVCNQTPADTRLFPGDFCRASCLAAGHLLFSRDFCEPSMAQKTLGMGQIVRWRYAHLNVDGRLERIEFRVWQGPEE